MTKTPTAKTVDSLRHDASKRPNIPTAEYQAVRNPLRVVVSLEDLI
jgi:hypothetical protein